MKSVMMCAVLGEGPDELVFGYDEDHYLCAQMKYRLVSAIRALAADGCREFASTLGEGVSLWGAEACIAIKQLGGDLCLIGAPLSEKQCERWHPERRERYYTALELCDRVIPPSADCFGEDYLFAAATHVILMGSPEKPRIGRLLSRASSEGAVIITP